MQRHGYYRNDAYILRDFRTKAPIPRLPYPIADKAATRPHDGGRRYQFGEDLGRCVRPRRFINIEDVNPFRPLSSIPMHHCRQGTELTENDAPFFKPLVLAPAGTVDEWVSGIVANAE